MDIHYVSAPVPYVVEEHFGGYFNDQDDLTYAQILLQDQETVHQSPQRNSESGTDRSSRNSSGGHPINTPQKPEGSSQTINVESLLAIDEAYARELQELENQLSHTSLNGTSGTERDFVHTQSSTSSNQGNVANNTLTQVASQDNVDPDNMTYEELQSLGDAIGTENRGLSDELICYLPTSTYKTGLFSRREKHDDCVICCMAYKNRDKLIILPCKHQYHKSCVTRWLKINKACPVCNEEVFGS